MLTYLHVPPLHERWAIQTHPRGRRV